MAKVSFIEWEQHKTQLEDTFAAAFTGLRGRYLES